MFNPLMKHFVRTWKQHFAMQMATVVVLSATFSVVGVSFLLHQNLNKVLTQWGDSISMSIFLKEDVEKTDELEKVIQTHEGVASVEYVSKESAAKLFKEQVEGYVPNLIFDGEFKNPLPASYEIKFGQEWTKEKYDEVVGFAKELAKFKEVEDISYGQSWVENYASVVEKFNSSSWLLIFVLLAGSLFVVGNSIRNSIAQRKDEIEILELIGSTKWSIRKPFIFEGLLLGFISSILSLFATYSIFQWQMSSVDSGVGILGGQYQLHYLSYSMQIFILVLGSLFGMVGAYFCVAKLSSGWSAEQAES